MDEIHAQMHYEVLVVCIAILLAVRTVVVTMLACTAYNLRARLVQFQTPLVMQCNVL